MRFWQRKAGIDGPRFHPILLSDQDKKNPPSMSSGTRSGRSEDLHTNTNERKTRENVALVSFRPPDEQGPARQHRQKSVFTRILRPPLRLTTTASASHARRGSTFSFAHHPLLFQLAIRHRAICHWFRCRHRRTLHGPPGLGRVERTYRQHTKAYTNGTILGRHESHRQTGFGREDKNRLRWLPQSGLW